MQVFEKSRWIWVKNGEGPDRYAEFLEILSYSGGKTLLNLSCDSDYTLFINGSYVASNQYGDFEHYKIYDTVDITGYLTNGKNRMMILVYHCGVPTQRYRPAQAGLIYEVLRDGQIVAFSREKTLSRISRGYVSGYQKVLTPQLGFTFFYDASKEAAEGSDEGFEPSVAVEKKTVFFPRPIKKLSVLPQKSGKIRTRYSGTHFLIDLGEEVVGLPTLELFSETEQVVTVAYGEHLEDGGVRKEIGGRTFAFEYKTRKGVNRFTHYMLRIGCRYLEVFAEQPIDLRDAGVLPQVYEVEEVPCKIEDPLDREIYDICVNTLKLCMMEHYVDTPWREQCLYAFDSRNQILCGYHAFRSGNTEYVKANLRLLAEDRREDGLLSICSPCGTKLAIPSFSLYFILEMEEYLRFSNDSAFIKDHIPKMEGILNEFWMRQKSGLIQTFEGSQMWNFYDWSPYMEGTLYQNEAATADLVLGCLFVMALDRFEQMCESTQTPFPYDRQTADALRVRIREKFLTPKGIFTMHPSAGREEYTVLGNSLAVLSGTAKGSLAKQVCEHIVGGELVDCSLSMKIFKYEALLKTDEERYREFVLSEIRKDYKRMLDAGSTTVWETVDGASAFANAGSLCHGWSAIPIYLYHKTGIAKAENQVAV